MIQTADIPVRETMTQWWENLQLNMDYVDYLIGQGLSAATVKT